MSPAGHPAASPLFRAALLSLCVAGAAATLCGCKNGPGADGRRAGARGGDTSATASDARDGALGSMPGSLSREQKERYFRVDTLIQQWDLLQQDGKDQEAAGIAEQIAKETDADFDAFAASSKGVHGVQAQHLAVEALGFSRRAEATDLLVARLQSDDAALVGNTLIALKVRSDPNTALPPIVRLLRSNVQEAKRYAPLALANVVLARERAGRPVEDSTAEQAMTGLVSLTQDRDAFVRLHTAKAMGALRRPEANDFLVLLFRDEHAKIRVAAAAAVERIGDPRTFPEVVRLLENLPEEHKPIVRDILASYAEKIQGKPLAPAEVKAMGTSSVAWDRWYANQSNARSKPAPGCTPPGTTVRGRP